MSYLLTNINRCVGCPNVVMELEKGSTIFYCLLNEEKKRVEYVDICPILNR